MQLFGRIEKIDDQPDGTIKVYGVASDETQDDQGEIVRADAMRAALPAYMAYPALREMHGLSAAGTTLEADVHDDGATRICAHVVDPVAVKKVKTKTYRGFSIGGTVTARDHLDRSIITGLKLNEISLVDRPANPSASLNLWKAGQTIEGKSDMPEGSLGSLGDIWPEPKQIWACGVSDHNHTGKVEALKCIETQKTATPKPEQPEQESVAKSDKSAADVLDEARKAIAAAERVDEPDDQASILKKALAAVTAAEKVLAKDMDGGAMEYCEEAGKAEDAEAKASGDDKPEGDYGDVEYADPGYQSDKKKRYPIDTEGHIRAAWNYINKPKNSGKYSDDQVAHIKSRIVAAWKDKIDPAGPPSAGKKKKGKKASQPEVRKTFHDLERLVTSSINLDWLVDYCDDGLEEDVPEAIGKSNQLLRNLIAEKTDEILDGLEMDRPFMLSKGVTNDWAEILRKTISDTDIAEALVKNLNKASHMNADQVMLALTCDAMKTMSQMDSPSRADQVHLAGSYGHAVKALMRAGGREMDGDNDADDDIWSAAKGGETGDTSESHLASDQKPGIDAGATQIAAPQAEPAPPNATQDTRDNAETEAPQDSEGKVPREPIPKASDGKLLDGFMNKASTALAASEVSARDTAALFGRMDRSLKAGAPPHQILMDVAHACLERVSDGATCKAAAPRPARHDPEMMAHLDGAHGGLLNMEGCRKCSGCSMGMASYAEPAGDVNKSGEEPAEKAAPPASIPAETKVASAADQISKTAARSVTEEELQRLVNAAVADAVAKAAAAAAVAKAAHATETADLLKTVSQLTDLTTQMAGKVDAMYHTEQPARALKMGATGSLSKAADNTAGVPAATGSHMDEVAKAMARMTPEQRTKAQFDLDYKITKLNGPIQVSSMAMQGRPGDPGSVLLPNNRAPAK